MRYYLIITLIAYLIDLIRTKETIKYTMITCPVGFQALTQYLCEIDNIYIPPNKCPTDKACSTSFLCQRENAPECPSLVKCPDSNPIRCPDNTCANTPGDCPNYVKCPPFLPVRCPNGDCRKKNEECPTSIYCKNSLCNDGSCRHPYSFCEKSTSETTCIDKSLVRCSDGTCQSSMLLCPSAKTCPQERYITSKGLCNTEVNSEETHCSSDQVLCQFDNSCAKTIDSCPTGIICPTDRPVKCWDMSCAPTISACPKYQDCPKGQTQCPDGSCTNDKITECGTHVTCSKDAPYRCFDNTCRVRPGDCPSMPVCPSEAPILCWDGRCLDDRGKCAPPEKCSYTTPIKCPNGICAVSANECKVHNGCPLTFVLCKDGTCRQKSSDCKEDTCGIDLPYKCENGMCVSDKKYCDSSNGCPFYSPYKCQNGACVTEKNKCDNIQMTIPDGMKKCPDGSIISERGVCPLENGCPSDTPLLCGDGTCVNPKNANCSIPICPIEAPYRCLDGKCVYTSAYCPSVNSTRNEDGLLTCADGKLAKSFEECRLLMPCDRYRCEDGTCKDSKEFCANATANYSCPAYIPERCDDGSCAESKIKCINSQGCPYDAQSRCPKNGLCAAKAAECTNYEGKFALSNGCSLRNPVKCISGKCAKSQADCGENMGCNDPVYHVRCPNGKCVKSLRQCTGEEECVNYCRYGILECSDHFEECFNDLNCTVDKPFRCPDGSCMRYPKKLGTASTEYNKEACPIGIRCPDHKPFLCANGECVAKKSFCISQPKCPEEAQDICFDRTCINDKDYCKDKCPAKSPLLCPNGNCVSSLYDCSVNDCPAQVPIRCYTGKCLDTPYECIIQNEEKRIIKSLCRDDEVTCYDGSCRSKFEDCPLFKGCVSMSSPYKCPSGGCAVNSTSCKVSEMDEKYENCTKKKKNVTEDELDLNSNYQMREAKELEDYVDLNEDEEVCWHYRHNCTGDMKICEDGICRKTCPSYNGCPYEKPLMCTNGECVKNEDECAGVSYCSSIDKPFKCIDGTCVKSFTECTAPLYRLGTTNILLSSFKNSDVDSDIIIGENNIPICSVYIPTNALLKVANNSEESYEGQITFRSVPQNELTGTFSKFDSSRKEDVLRAYPFADPNTTYSIDHIFSLLSTVVEIKFDCEDVEVRQNLILTLMFDFPTALPKLEMANETASLFKELDPYTDICLAKLNGKQWECQESLPEIRKTDKFRLKGSINTQGIYAVILNPIRNENQLIIKKYWLISNLKAIAIIAAIIVVLVLAIGYYMLRQYRYRMKYKENQLLALNQQKELENMADLNTTVVGQSFEDVARGIVFTDNPAYKKKADKDATAKRMKEESEYYRVSDTLNKLEKDNKLLKEKLDEAKKIYNDAVNGNNPDNMEMNNQDPSINSSENRGSERLLEG